MSGWLRTRDTANARDSRSLVLANGAPLANDFMADAAVKGTTAMDSATRSRCQCRPNAEFIEVGAMMQGKGTLWLDDVELEVQ